MPRPSEWVIKDCGSELSARALQVAISGFVADDDPTIIADLVQEIERLRKALEAGIHWASTRCPCENEKPDPCPLCGAWVATDGCKSVESIFPQKLLSQWREALTPCHLDNCDG